MTAPPYARIVEDIRRRIADGRLRPGDRVPSTRQLARDWEVALATAAKALTVLAQEGAVVAEPRVGTIVAEIRGGRARRATVPSGDDLTRDRIVAAAVEIADADGLAELTMRGVAGRLGVATMSLYRHVGGKDDLVMLMIDHVIREFPLPDPPPDGWRARLETAAQVQWAGYRTHPWMARVTSLTRPLPSASLIAHTEWVMRTLEGSPLDPVSKMHVHTLLFSFVQGLAANIEMEQQAQAATGLTADEWMTSREGELQALAESGRLTAFTGVIEELGGEFDLDLDRLFAFGLDALLDGLAGLVEGR
ncbi:TetR/AcrR family transcriptional regulator C-terminal domain-containing protein [Nonomuraea sp. NPDC003560]|uniref:TetR/AcrR family transcriptional regulator C-terminal domain-containing protein n=1 Tax=Nonomuraea sp. NPDC003560 TaxID=3364341 RepID=UPI0036B9A1F4